MMKGSEYYRQKYALGLVDVSNSLQTYDEFLHKMGFVFSLEELVEQQLPLHAPVKVLDIGCGDAGALSGMKQRFGKKVQTIGLDLIAFPEKNADVLLVGDALELAFPDNCNLVFSFRALHEIGFAEKILEKVAACLAPKGIAILFFRLKNIVSQTAEWSGDMTEEDEQFLFSAAQQNRFNGCLISGKLVRETLLNTTPVVTGIIIKLVKQETV